MKNKKINLSLVLQGNINQRMQLLENYLQARAIHENVEWELTNQYLVNHFEQGCRDFFGIRLNEQGFPLFDTNEPAPGFLNNFINWFLITNCNNSN